MSHQRPIFKGLQMNFLYSTLKVKKRKIRKFDLRTDGKAFGLNPKVGK